MDGGLCSQILLLNLLQSLNRSIEANDHLLECCCLDQYRFWWDYDLRGLYRLSSHKLIIL